MTATMTITCKACGCEAEFESDVKCFVCGAVYETETGVRGKWVGRSPKARAGDEISIDRLDEMAKEYTGWMTWDELILASKNGFVARCDTGTRRKREFVRACKYFGITVVTKK